MNGETWLFNSKTALPHAGIWTFDFVHKVKPPAHAVAMSEEQFMELIGWNFDVQGARMNHNHINSETCIFADTQGPEDTQPDMSLGDDSSGDDNATAPSPPCRPLALSDWQLVSPLPSIELQSDLHGRSRALCNTCYFTLRQAMMLVSRIGKLHLQIDIIVSLWPRIIDWHGFDQVCPTTPKQQRFNPNALF